VTDVRSRGPASILSALVLAGFGLALLTIVLLPPGGLMGAGHPTGAGPSWTSPAAPGDGRALPSVSSIFEVGSPPTGGVVGDPLPFLWQAVGPGGARASTFEESCELQLVVSENGSEEPAWVNSSVAGPLHRSGGWFPVPAAAWSDGVLGLNVTPGMAAPVTLSLLFITGVELEAIPAPVNMTILPDLVHLVLYDPVLSSVNATARTNDTFWHVRDRFRDPTPGARLFLEYSTATSVTKTVEPVIWASADTTGAWVNSSAQGAGSGTFRVLDAANATLLGPTPVPALAVASTPTTPASLSPLALAAVALVAVGGCLGITGLLFGGRSRSTPSPHDGEEDLRRLAEGRATVVELLRRSGPLSLAEIEAAWEPPPAPPAVADWLASLVTDGTLTATLGEGGRARFAVAERPSEELKVTFDEATLEREMARRDAAAEEKDEGST